MAEKSVASKLSNRKRLRKIEQRIGRALYNVRNDLGLSMADLVRAASITHQQIYKIERGVNRLTFSRFHIFMRHMGISPQLFYEMVFETGWKTGE